MGPIIHWNPGELSGAMDILDYPDYGYPTHYYNAVYREGKDKEPKLLCNSRGNPIQYKKETSALRATAKKQKS